jgi:hypothetical protein
MRDIILGVAVAWGIYKGAMLAAALVAPILTLVKAIQMLAAGQKLATVAQWAFNTAANANPIGLIITGIGIFIGLIIACEGKIQRLTGVLQLLGMVLAVVFLPALAAISPLLAPIIFFIGFIYSMIHELVSSWYLVVEAFQNEGIIGAIKRMGGVLLSGLLAPIQGLLELLAKIPGMNKVLGPAVNKIAEFRNTLKGIENKPIEVEADANPAAAANTATPSRVTQPAARALPVSPAVSSTSPATSVSTGTAAPQTPGAIRQPALLNLSPAASPQTASAAPAASAWMVPAVISGVEDVTPPALAAAPAVTRTVTAGVSPAPAVTTVTGTAGAASPAPAAARAVRLPVEYSFPEMIIPPDIIKTISVPVEWAITAALPPERAGRIVPPVSGSVGQGLTPPEPPMTQAEQIIYSRTDNYENVRVELVPEEGIAARVVKGPKSPNVKVVVSGDA